jgi:DNA-binding response OmpR family regulator
MPQIMIIDDDETMVSLLKTLLEMDGFEVSFTEAWLSIPREVEGTNPDILLMDCNLPQVDGLQILSEMRRGKALASLPIIMTSGMDMEFKAMAAGANAFLLKPYTPDTLYQLIQSLLDSHPGPDRSINNQEND